MSKSVLKEWMNKLTFCEQSTIISSFRTPDGIYAHNIRIFTKWMRAISQNDGKDSDYMYINTIATINESKLLDELKLCSLDYAIHFLQALEVIGFKHPDFEVSRVAKAFYINLVRMLNFNPELPDQMTSRLQGKQKEIEN